eukprot:scaffold176661_cov36-Tisochrysis_lutea.AAC.1
MKGTAEAMWEPGQNSVGPMAMEVSTSGMKTLTMCTGRSSEKPCVVWKRCPPSMCGSCGPAPGSAIKAPSKLWRASLPRTRLTRGCQSPSARAAASSAGSVRDVVAERRTVDHLAKCERGAVVYTLLLEVRDTLIKRSHRGGATRFTALDAEPTLEQHDAVLGEHVRCRAQRLGEQRSLSTLLIGDDDCEPLQHLART